MKVSSVLAWIEPWVVVLVGEQLATPAAGDPVAHPVTDIDYSVAGEPSCSAVTHRYWPTGISQ